MDTLHKGDNDDDDDDDNNNKELIKAAKLSLLDIIIGNLLLKIKDKQILRKSSLKNSEPSVFKK